MEKDINSLRLIIKDALRKSALTLGCVKLKLSILLQYRKVLNGTIRVRPAELMLKRVIGT